MARRCWRRWSRWPSSSRIIEKLLECGLSLIPPDSVIAPDDSTIFTTGAPKIEDWRTTRERIAGMYGYDKFTAATAIWCRITR